MQHRWASAARENLHEEAAARERQMNEPLWPVQSVVLRMRGKHAPFLFSVVVFCGSQAV